MYHSGSKLALELMTGVLMRRHECAKRPRGVGHVKMKAGVGAGGAPAKKAQGLPGDQKLEEVRNDFSLETSKYGPTNPFILDF